MIALVDFKGNSYRIDLTKPLDISIPLKAGFDNVNAWYVAPVKMEPVKTERFMGSVAAGGAVNFRNISFNPHGNGTHTECVGHISEEIYCINDAVNRSFFTAELITIEPEEWTEDQTWRKNGDKIILKEQLQSVLEKQPEALVIRTTPNDSGKLTRQYSHSNPAYLCDHAATAIREAGVKHLLIDLPSVDREVDGGLMLSHRAFWNYPENPVMDATITELIYVKNDIADGSYLIEIQLAPFVNDASPSKPCLYAIH